MKITHKLNSTALAKNIRKDINFLITNKIGGYCLLGDKPISRYQGVFLLHNSDMYKIIEDIKLLNAGLIKEILNKFSSIERKKGKFREEFFMPYGYDALVYELNQPGETEITLDIRKSYGNPELGRIYNISKSKTGIIVNYKHEKTNMYLVIKSDSNDFKIIDEWIKREYNYDKERQTYPSEKYIYKALSIKAKKIVFAFFPAKKQAIEEAEYVFKNLERLKEHQKIYVSNINGKKPRDMERKMAKKCAISSLNKLVVNLKNTRGIFAGLPWFFQFWSRDELISLKALLLNSQEREVKDILLKNLNAVKEGVLPNITMPNSSKSNADAIGWLFKRIQDSLFIFSEKEKAKIKTKLVAAINHINKNLIKEDLVYNKAKQTWMDTEYQGDNREGFRIEIQVLFLNMLKLAYELTRDEKYFKREIEIRNTIREKFWNGKILADGLDDFTIRPNIFIAAYLYPELLSIKEWTICFENIIPKLWLAWGGFASIDKKHPLFCKDYTGEIKQSYHRGDSWFWANNLAALVLHRTNKRKFKNYIEKIIKASSKEILFSGAIGHSAELSSASAMKSQGCFAQAWSNAMFIELIDEI